MASQEESVSNDVESIPRPPSAKQDESSSSSSSSSDADSESHTTQQHEQHGSSVAATIFNFANCIIGAGAIGLGGAFAASGGIVSVLTLLLFGILTKISLDMVISLSVTNSEGNSDETCHHCSYEALASKACGRVGWASVIASKSLYSFGCLVAYIVVIKDNFASALRHLLPLFLWNDDSALSSWSWLENNNIVTLTLSVFIIFPLCLLRDMTSLSNLSFVSVVSMVMIVVIVVYLYVDNPGDIRQPGEGVYHDWLEVRPGFVESLGTFVFTFVSQHTVHLTYESLRPEIRTFATWKTVSFYSILISSIVSLSIGLVVYMTFWESAQSDLFEMYPSSLYAIDASKLLLCVTMLLTFPLPFFTTRDMVVLCLMSCMEHERQDASPVNGAPMMDDSEELEEPLLNSDLANHDRDTSDWLLLPDQERQLKLPYHVAITFLLWSLTTFLAIVAPSLGDVLDLVGCATGTVIAFVLPSVFSFQLQGYSHTAAVVLVVGGVVGSLGTYQSIRQLIADA